MSNEALITIAKTRSNLTRFRLCIIDPQCPDYLTNQPLDDGFGAIVEHCKNLTQLFLSGLLTDQVFKHIGTHAKKLEMLSLGCVWGSIISSPVAKNSGSSRLGIAHLGGKRWWRMPQSWRQCDPFGCLHVK